MKQVLAISVLLIISCGGRQAGNKNNADQSVQTAEPSLYEDYTAYRDDNRIREIDTSNSATANMLFFTYEAIELSTFNEYLGLVSNNELLEESEDYIYEDDVTHSCLLMFPNGKKKELNNVWGDSTYLIAYKPIGYSQKHNMFAYLKKQGNVSTYYLLNGQGKEFEISGSPVFNSCGNLMYCRLPEAENGYRIYKIEDGEPILLAQEMTWYESPELCYWANKNQLVLATFLPRIPKPNGIGGVMFLRTRKHYNVSLHNTPKTELGGELSKIGQDNGTVHNGEQHTTTVNSLKYEPFDSSRYSHIKISYNEIQGSTFEKLEKNSYMEMYTNTKGYTEFLNVKTLIKGDKEVHSVTMDNGDEVELVNGLKNSPYSYKFLSSAKSIVSFIYNYKNEAPQYCLLQTTSKNGAVKIEGKPLFSNYSYYICVQQPDLKEGFDIYMGENKLTRILTQRFKSGCLGNMFWWNDDLYFQLDSIGVRGSKAITKYFCVDMISKASSPCTSLDELLSSDIIVKTYGMFGDDCTPNLEIPNLSYLKKLGTEDIQKLEGIDKLCINVIEPTYWYLPSPKEYQIILCRSKLDKGADACYSSKIGVVKNGAIISTLHIAGKHSDGNNYEFSISKDLEIMLTIWKSPYLYYSKAYTINPEGNFELKSEDGPNLFLEFSI